MSALSLSRLPVPSSRLLKFLRAQSDPECFFTANRPGAISCCHNTSAPDNATGISAARAASLVRRLSTTAKRAATVESSSSLDSLPPGTVSGPPRRTSPILQTVGHPRTFCRRDVLFPKDSRRTISESRPWRQGILRLGKKAKRKDATTHDCLRPLASFLDNGTESSVSSFGRVAANKAANELKLRCTEFDEQGRVTLVNGEFKKSELIAKYGLLPRDLRKIDSSLLPIILVRESAILVNLLHIRALIKADRILVFDAYGSTDSYTQSTFMYDLEGKLQQKEGSRQAGGLPYEFRALEAVLISVTAALESEFEGVREPVVRVLRELEEDIDRDKLRYLLVYSKKLGTFEQRAKLVRDAIDELLEADDDLAAMYLTEKAKGIGRGEDDHTEVEMLLESYHKVCDEIVQVSGNLVSNIRNTEEIVKAILDSNRNSLMLLDLKFSIGTLGIGSGAFVAALYGMNLKNFIEESDLGFLGVSALSFVFSGVICAYGLHKLRRVQRVTMWGESGRGKRGSWRDVDPVGLAPGQSPSPSSSSPLQSSSSASITPSSSPSSPSPLSPSSSSASRPPMLSHASAQAQAPPRRERMRFHEARKDVVSKGEARQ